MYEKDRTWLVDSWGDRTYELENNSVVDTDGLRICRYYEKTF